MPAVSSTPLPSTSPLPLPSAYGFNPTFFQPYVPQSRCPAVGETSAPGPRISYCEATHGSHADFCRGPDFSRYRNEVRQNLDFLGDFCRQHRVPNADRIIRRFDLFFNRRFNLAHFDTHAHLIDSAGKRALDNICDMIRDERISLDTRKSAISDLSKGLDVCASGTTANLLAADRELALSSEGIRPALWKVKQNLTHDILLQAVSAEHEKATHYVGNEIHYFNAAWNYVADSVGLSEIPDLMARTLEPSFLERCKNDLHAAMMPGRLARVMAKQCLDIFTTGLAARKIPSSGDYTARTNEAFGELLLEIRQQYQLGPDTLRLHTFARLDDDGIRYDLRCDSSLVARDLLIAMYHEDLLNEAPLDWGAWQGADGEQYTLYTFGADLAWRMRHYGACSGASPGASEWDANADVEPVTISDLRAWCAVWRHDGNPPPNAVRQAILAAGPEELVDIPDDWLRDPETIRAVLAMSKLELVRRCLQANFSYFVQELPSTERAALIDDYMGADEAILKLACRWYVDPWMMMAASRGAQRKSRLQRWMALGNAKAIDAVLGSVDGKPYLETGRRVPTSTIYLVLRGLESKPALAEAMIAKNVGAIDAWRRLVSHPAVIDRVKYRLPELLMDIVRTGALFPNEPRARFNDKVAGVIKAFHHILTDPAILPHIAKELPALLACKSADGIPGLLTALQAGGSCDIKAFHALLVDPALLPHIKHKLPELLAARSPAGYTAIDKALAHGRWNSINAFRAILTDPLILPHIVHQLPKLLTTKVRDGKTGLSAALRDNQHMAIRAYCSLLADPAITPHIKHLLPKLLAAKTDHGDPGLARALNHGRALAIRAFHEMVAHPNILPHISRALPKLLAAKQRTGTPGFSLALRNNHAAAIVTFGDMLADPMILPHIQHVLVDLLAARDASGTTGASLAAQEEQFQAMASFIAILEKPAIAQHIEGRMMEVLPPLQARTAASSPRVERSSPGPHSSPRGPVRRFFHRVVESLTGQRAA